VQPGRSFGAVWTGYHVARRVGLARALGTTRAGQLALGQVLARVLAHGSRLSAVRLALAPAAWDVLGFGPFEAAALSETLAGLAGAQARREDRRLAQRQKMQPASRFWSAVTRSS